MRGKELIREYKDTEVGDFMLKGIDKAAKSRFCKLAVGVILLSSAVDLYKTTDNLDNGDALHTASSAIHLGTEFPLAVGLTKLRKNALNKSQLKELPANTEAAFTTDTGSESDFKLVSNIS